VFFKQIDLIGPQLKLAHKLREEIDHDHGEEQAIDTVEDTAVAGDDLAAVFNVGLAFDEGFGQVSQGGGDADEDAKQKGEVPGDVEGEHGKEDGGGDGEDQAADDAFPGFAGADAGGEFVAAKEVAGEEGASIEAPDA